MVDYKELRLERLGQDDDELARVSLVLCDGDSNELLGASVAPSKLFLNVLWDCDLEVSNLCSTEQV